MYRVSGFGMQIKSGNPLIGLPLYGIRRTFLLCYFFVQLKIFVPQWDA